MAEYRYRVQVVSPDRIIASVLVGLVSAVVIGGLIQFSGAGTGISVLVGIAGGWFIGAVAYSRLRS